MSENVSKKITVYNFIMTMGIVVYRWKNFYFLAGYNEPYMVIIERLFDIFGFVAMGTFFMMSGFLLYHGANNVDDMKVKMKKRIFSLLIPLLAWNTIAFLYTIAYGLIRDIPLDLSLKAIVKGYTVTLYDGPLWYLIALLMLMLLSPVMIKLKEYGKGPALGCSALILLGICAAVYFLECCDWKYASWCGRFFRYWFAYFTGVYCALRHDETISCEKYNTRLAMCIAVVCTILVTGFILVSGGVQNSIVYFILMQFLSISVWLSAEGKVFEKTQIGFGLKISFFIYATHYVFLIPNFNSLVILFVRKYAIPGGWLVGIHFLLILLLYGLVWLGARFLKKILPEKYFMALSGGRT